MNETRPLTLAFRASALKLMVWNNCGERLNQTEASGLVRQTDIPLPHVVRKLKKRFLVKRAVPGVSHQNKSFQRALAIAEITADDGTGTTVAQVIERFIAEEQARDIERKQLDAQTSKLLELRRDIISHGISHRDALRRLDRTRAASRSELRRYILSDDALNEAFRRLDALFATYLERAQTLDLK